jgi:hypothetical protein
MLDAAGRSVRDETFSIPLTELKAKVSKSLAAARAGFSASAAGAGK